MRLKRNASSILFYIYGSHDMRVPYVP